MSTTIPSGFKEALSKYPSPFDKEALVDEDKELWLIRIPDNLSEEDLVNFKFKAPTKASQKALGKFDKDNDNYALFKVPTQDNQDEMTEEENIDFGISGHEMVGFDCLVPSREDNGKLTFAPKKFDQYLILNQVVDIPDTVTYAQSVLDTPVYKRDQPEGLKMRFLPYGSLSEQVTADDKPIQVKIEETKSELIEDDKKRKRGIEADDEGKKKVKKEKKEKKEKKKDKKEKK